MSALAQVCDNSLTPVSEQDQDAPVKNEVMSGSSQDEEVVIIRVVEGRRKRVVDLTGSSEDEGEEVKNEADGFKIIDLTGLPSDDDSDSEKTGGLVKQNHVIIDLCGDNSDEEDFSCPRKRPKLLEQKNAVQSMLHFLSDSCTSNSLPLEKGSIESCFESLSKSSLEPLMKTLGLPKSDSKVRVAETFVAFIAKHVPPTYRFVCCIDVGSRNLAWIIYDIERKCIVQWKKLDIKEKVTVAAYHSKLSKIVPKEMVLPCTSVKDYYFLIEKQHHASNQNKTIESLLFAAVGGSADEFEPRSVSSFRKEQLLLRWNTVTHMDKKFLKGRGDKGKASGNTHYFRKKEAVILVNCLLKEHALTFADDEVHLSYQNADKKDDLADVYIMLKFFLKRVSTVIEWYNRIQKDKTDGIN